MNLKNNQSSDQVISKANLWGKRSYDERTLITFALMAWFFFLKRLIHLQMISFYKGGFEGLEKEVKRMTKMDYVCILCHNNEI